MVYFIESLSLICSMLHLAMCKCMLSANPWPPAPAPWVGAEPAQRLRSSHRSCRRQHEWNYPKLPLALVLSKKMDSKVCTTSQFPLPSIDRAPNLVSQLLRGRRRFWPADTFLGSCVRCLSPHGLEWKIHLRASARNREPQILHPWVHRPTSLVFVHTLLSNTGNTNRVLRTVGPRARAFLREPLGWR